MIVQVIAERMNQIDGVVPGLLVRVSGEQDWKIDIFYHWKKTPTESNISDVVADPGVGAILQFERRFADGVEDLGRRLTGFAPFAELLESWGIKGAILPAGRACR